MDNLTFAYAGDIVKTKDEMGNLIVYGKATGPDLDLDEQICDPQWLKSAMPEWMQWGNVREMHQPIAAGVGIELNAEGDDWMLKSEVIDANTARKIEAGALKGYSVGIKNAKVVKDANAPGGRIVGGTIVEVSYVDRPCNPTATTTIAKAVGGDVALAAVEATPMTENEAAAVASYKAGKAADARAILKDAIVQELGTEKDSWKPEDTYQPTNPEFYEDPKICPECDGLGKHPETGMVCSKCDGSGHVDQDMIEPGESPSTETVLEEKASEPEVEKAKPMMTNADVRAAIADTPDEWKQAAADVEKVEHDPATLASVRAGLVTLIKAELDEMLAGEEDETADVSRLLAALNLFLCWWEGEAAEGETAAPFMTDDEPSKEDDMAYVALGVNPDTIKAASDGSESAVADLKNEILKALGLEEIETAKAAQREELNFLKAELERIKEMAAPGGPALTRTQGQAHKSAEAERLEAEAARYRHIAQQVSDPALAASYIEKASKMDTSARQIAGA